MVQEVTEAFVAALQSTAKTEQSSKQQHKEQDLRRCAHLGPGGECVLTNMNENASIRVSTGAFTAARQSYIRNAIWQVVPHPVFRATNPTALKLSGRNKAINTQTTPTLGTSRTGTSTTSYAALGVSGSTLVDSPYLVPKSQCTCESGQDRPGLPDSFLYLGLLTRLDQVNQLKKLLQN